MGKIRIGIIGTGRIAKRFVQDANRVEHAEINCIYNPRIESARRFAEENGNLFYTNEMDVMLERVDMVYIASPHDTHVKYARTLLQNGKHVLCEKPMAFRKSEAEALFALAKEKGCLLREAVKTSYCPGFLAMMEVAKSGKIGEIRDVEACFTKLTPENLRELTDLNYGGSMTELGSYVLLPILRLLGTDYKKVTFHSIPGANGLDLYTRVIVDYVQGIGTGKIGLGVKSEGNLVISGTKGYIYADAPWWLTKKFEVRYEDPNQREVYEYLYEGSGLQYELKSFVKEVRNGENCIGIQPKESIAVTDIMEIFLMKKRSRVF